MLPKNLKTKYCSPVIHIYKSWVCQEFEGFERAFTALFNKAREETELNLLPNFQFKSRKEIQNGAVYEWIR